MSTSLKLSSLRWLGVWLVIVICIRNKLNIWYTSKLLQVSNRTIRCEYQLHMHSICCSYSVNMWMTQAHLCSTHLESILYSSFRSTLTRTSIQLLWDISSLYHSSNMVYMIAVIHRHIKCHLWLLTFVSLDTHSISHFTHLEPHNRAQDSYSLEYQIPQFISLEIFNHHWDMYRILTKSWYKWLNGCSSQLPLNLLD